MPSLLVPSVPFYRNPTFRPALAALVEFLMGRNYSGHMVGRIFDFAAVHGTLEGSMIEPEDMEAAESTFVDNLPEIPFDNPAWGEPDRADTGEYPTAAAPIAAEAPDSRDVALKLMDAKSLPPLSGGSPEFTPSAEDLADYAAWSAELDARRDAEDFYRRHPLDEFDAIRTD
jgi:hypothetical protein